MVNIANILVHPSEKSKKNFFRISSLFTKGEFTRYPFFVRFRPFLLLLEKVCAFSSAFL